MKGLPRVDSYITMKSLGVIMNGRVPGWDYFSCGLNQLYWLHVHTSLHVIGTYACIIQIDVPTFCVVLRQ